MIGPMPILTSMRRGNSSAAYFMKGMILWQNTLPLQLRLSPPGRTSLLPKRR
nr:MAG TPA: hypothetical protein [Caudoviricetes sp.]